MISEMERAAVASVSSALANASSNISSGPLVVDDEQRVDVFAHFFGSGEGFVDFLESFEQERYGDDAYGEEPSLACYACHDGGGSCACASAHACGDEDHVDVRAE